MADRMTLTRTADGWTGEVTHRGRRHLCVEFSPHAAEQADPAASAALCPLVAIYAFGPSP